MIGLRDLQREINENSKKNAKWANILNHNVDFYDSFEVKYSLCTIVLTFCIGHQLACLTIDEIQLIRETRVKKILLLF